MKSTQEALKKLKPSYLLILIILMGIIRSNYILPLIFIVISILFGLVLEFKIKFCNKLWIKLAFGLITGTFFATWITFALSLILGFSFLPITLTMIIFSVIIYAIIHKKFKEFVHQLKDFSGFPLIIYFCLIIFVSFFVFGIFKGKNDEVRFVGNFSDLAYHTAMCEAFNEQDFLPSQNPQSSGYPLIYHFMTNFHSAILAKCGLKCFTANILMNFLYSISLVLLTYSLLKAIFKNKKEVSWTMLLLFTCHNGIINLIFVLLGQKISGYSILDSNFKFTLDSLINIVTYPYFNFLNININLFQPQRPFLLGLPLALISYRTLINLSNTKALRSLQTLFLSILAGLMPLFHFHSFLIIALSYFSCLLTQRNLKRIGKYLLITTLLALPQLIFLVYNKVTERDSFSSFDFPKELLPFENNANTFSHRIYLWIRIASPVLVLGYIGLFYILRKTLISSRKKNFRLTQKQLMLTLLFLVTLLSFVVITFYQFTPSWGDNNKFFFYHLLFLSIIGGYTIYSLMHNSKVLKIIIPVLIGMLYLLPFLTEFIVIWTKRIDYLRGIDKTEVLSNPAEYKVAQWIKDNTDPDSVFLTSNHIIHFLPALTGRTVVNGAYTWNTGIQKENIIKKVENFYGTFDKEEMEGINFDYILISPKEKLLYDIHYRNFYKLDPVYSLADTQWGDYSIYKLRAAKNIKQNVEEKNKVYLDELEPIFVQQDFGELLTNQGIDQSSLELAEVKYNKGLATHANSTIIYQLDGNDSNFHAIIGLDSGQACEDGSIVFLVYIDDKKIYQSAEFQHTSTPITLDLDITDASVIVLKVNDTGDGIKCDHATWADAYLTK